MNKNLLAILVVLTFACAWTEQSRADTGLAGFNIDTSAIRWLDKAESLYSLGNYNRAFFIYRHELAPIGDKYAQYMVGYMLLTGQGTDADRVAATAWYRLAAERGTREFVLVHNQLLVSLTSEQVSEYERTFLDLRRRYGDLPLLLRAFRKDYDLLKRRTGSRLGSETGAVTVIELRNRSALTSTEEYFKRIESRLESRLALIGQYIDIKTDDLDVDTLDLRMIERQVDQALNSLD